jgi:hypothetical protein
MLDIFWQKNFIVSLSLLDIVFISVCDTIFA